jgi:hypothetical protein
MGGRAKWVEDEILGAAESSMIGQNFRRPVFTAKAYRLSDEAIRCAIESEIAEIGFYGAHMPPENQIAKTMTFGGLDGIKKSIEPLPRRSKEGKGAVLKANNPHRSVRALTAPGTGTSNYDRSPHPYRKSKKAGASVACEELRRRGPSPETRKDGVR